MRERVQA